MIITKKVFVFFVCLIAFQFSFGQNNPVDLRPLLHNIPPSPTAAALGDYANIDYSVKNYTGMSQVTIPIYNINVKNFNLPISLSYNPRGVKVNETPSWVGLSWSLNAGGVITRSVKNKPDDFKKGLLLTGVSDSIKNITDEDTYANALRIGYIYDMNYTVTATRGSDTEPDLFNFNFNGITGKFLFGDDHKIKLIPYQNLDIKYVSDTEGRIIEFTIIDEKGITYVFNDVERTSISSFYSVFPTTAYNLSNGGDGFSQHISSWYLSKIILPNSEEINLFYDNELIHVQYMTSMTFRNCPDGNCETSINAQYNYPAYASSSSDGSIEGKRLIRIEYSDGKIDFEGGVDRTDLAGSKPLASIKVYSKIKVGSASSTYKFIKGYNFSYTYNNGDNHVVSKFRPTTNDHNDYSKRLILRSVVEIGMFGNTFNNGYRFDYNESSILGHRFSPEQDFWGYYNHNGSNTMVPSLYIYPQDFTSNQIVSIFKRTQFSGPELILPGANRAVNPNYITLGVLTKITYPTNGSIQFDYEPNDFYFLGRNIQGGGIRLKKTILYDGIDHSRDIIKQFTYTQSDDVTRSSGRLLSLPNFFYIENTFPYEDPFHKNPNYIDSRNYSIADLEYYNKFLSRLIEPRYCLGGSDGLDVGYKEVNEIQSNNGKINYRFSVPGVIGQTNDGGEECDFYEDGYCDGLFTPFASHYCQDYYGYRQYIESGYTGKVTPDLKGMTFNYYYQYPFVESTNYDWNRGLLLAKKEFDNNSKLIRETKYTYQLYFPRNKTLPTYINALKIGTTENWKLDFYYNRLGTLSNAGSPTSDLYVFSKYKIITEVAKTLKQITTSLYDKNGNVMSSTENFKYQSLYHPHYTLKQWVDNKGDSWEEQFIYPNDLGNLTSTTQPAKGFASLITKHMNPIVWTRKLLIKGSSKFYVDGQILFYDAFNNMTLPSVFKKLNLYKPEPLESFGDVTGEGDVTLDARYNNLVNYEGYKSDNLIQYKKKETAVESQLWGYNDRYVVANVQNAIISDIAYTSFETFDDKGGWEFDNTFQETNSYAPNIPSINAITGRRIYQLGNTTGGIAKNNLDPSKVYKLTFWYNDSKPSVIAINALLLKDLPGTKMSYCEFEISNTSSVKIQSSSSSSIIDELRLYPAKAQMATYTYDPLVGITSSSDVKNQINYFEYDEFLRLIKVKNKDGNIVRQTDYHYQTQ